MYAGCELSSERSSYTFQVPEEWQCEQQLALRTVRPWGGSYGGGVL